MNFLDLIVGIACTISALSCFTIHILSSPRKVLWRRRPDYLRLPILLFGAASTFRAINLIFLAFHPSSFGHVNDYATVASILLAWVFLAGAIDAARGVHSVGMWKKVNALETKDTRQAYDRKH